jgi:predicted aldo/keto reductase-like oxidoreductase
MSRKRLARIDYLTAENACPQKMPIAKLMQHAIETLSDEDR